MKCRCGYDNTPLPGERAPQRCEGCGTPLRPGDDDPRDQKPGPRVYSNDDAVIVDDDLRERYPRLDEDVLVIHTLRYEWCNGIGAAPYGHHVREEVVTVTYEDGCERCGATEARRRFEQNGAGTAGIRTVTCTRCDHEHDRTLLH